MPYISVGDDIELFYEDSGPLPSATYKTYVFIHGSGFDGRIFKRLFPFAQSHNIRVVSMFRRDYPPSTPLRPAETQMLSEGADAQTQFLREQGNELATFLDGFIQTSNILPVHEASESNGGIVVIGWSLGSLVPLAMLAHIDSIPLETRQRLSKYLHTIILHETGPYTFGYLSPPQYDFSYWLNPDPVKRFELFLHWVTGYYEHEDVASGLVEKLEFNTPSDKAHTFSDVPPEELPSLLSPEPYNGSDRSVILIDSKVYNETTHRALFDTTLVKMLPKVRVRFLSSVESPGYQICAPFLLQKDIAERKLFGRDIGFSLTKSGNHFVFWDNPEEALASCRRCIHE